MTTTAPASILKLASDDLMEAASSGDRTPSISEEDGWEEVATPPEVTFDADDIVVVDDSKCMKHCQSTPNLRAFDQEEADDDTFSLVSRQDSVVVVPGVSFRDAMLRRGAASPQQPPAVLRTPKSARAKVRPQFVVTPIRRNSKSMGDLRAKLFEEGEDVLGDSDAALYYMQKSAGASSRRNGKKLRPDESKRLQITMAKKTLQKQKQGRR